MSAIVLATVMGGAGSLAAEPAMVVSSASGQAPDVPVTTGVAALDTVVRLRNAEADAGGARAFRVDAVLRRREDGLSVPLAWTRLDGGEGALVAPGGELVLRLRADLPGSGVYEAAIETVLPAVAGAPERFDRRISIAVTREVPPVPSDLIVKPDPVRQVRWPWQSGRGSVLVELRNTTSKAIEFGAPAVLGFDRGMGDSREAVASDRLPTLDASGCSSPLQPGTRCPLRLRLDYPGVPGRYSVQVGLGGAGGGWSHADVAISVRRPLFVSMLVTAIGVGGGWFVQGWRASGRRAVAALIRTGVLRRRIASIVGGTPGIDLSFLTRPVLDALEESEARCRAGDDVAEKADELEARVTRLETAASVELVFRKLPPDARAVFGSAHDRFMQSAAAAMAGHAAGGYDDGASAMVGNLNAWQGLADARAPARSRLLVLDALLALRPVGDAASAAARSARDSLANALDAAAAAIPADCPATAVADRTAALDAAAAADGPTTLAIGAYADDLRPRLQAIEADDAAMPDRRKWAAEALARLHDLDRAVDGRAKVKLLGDIWPMADPDRGAGLISGKALEGNPIQPSGAVSTSLDLPVAIAWNLVPGRTLRSLRRQQALMEWLTNLVVLVGLSLSGAVAVGADPGWGSPMDVVKLLLLGLGSRIVIGELGAASQPLPSAR